MTAPGVVVTTAVRSGPTGSPRAVSGQYFTTGITERGDATEALKVNSMGDYRRLFGNRTSYTTIYDDLQMYFECGGQQAYVLRAVGSAATKGFLSLMDGQVTPAATVRIQAANEGAWSADATVTVENGTNGSTTRKITIALDGAVVQTENNLATVDDIISAFSNSPYVVASDLGSPATGTAKLPALLAATPLSAGTDDRASVNAARIAAVLPAFKIGLGDGAVAAPGFGQSVHAALITHASINRRIALLGAARGTSVSALAALGLTLAANDEAQFAGLFAPFVIVPDGVGGTRALSPEGYVASARAKAHELFGPWEPGAGEGSISPYILGVDQEFTYDDASTLDDARVSPIRLVANKIRLYGWRSLSADDTDYASLAVQDTLNRLVTECEARLEPYVFRTIDGRGQLLSQMAGVLIGVLEPIRAAGGIFERIDPDTNKVLDNGYSVDVSPDVNTVDSLANNEVNAQVAVRLSPNASLINLTIVKVGLSAAV